MDHSVTQAHDDYWWMGVLLGVVTMLFGIAALFWPGLTLVMFVYLFSIYVLVWGVVSMVRTLVGTKGLGGAWWLGLLFGIAAVGLGVFLVRNPIVSFATLILLVGFTFIVRGIFDVVGGLFEQKTATSKMLSIVAGVIGVIAGIFILQQPVSGGVAFVWIVGLYSLIAGPLLIALAVDERDSSVVAVPAGKKA